MSEAADRARPDPRTARDAEELVEALRQLRTWAGEPSLRRLTALAGQRQLPDGQTVDALPSSTLSDNLGGRRLPRLPRRSFVNAFVTACMRAQGCADDEIAAEVQKWRQALRRITASASPAAADNVAQPPQSEPAPAPQHAPAASLPAAARPVPEFFWPPTDVTPPSPPPLPAPVPAASPATPMHARHRAPRRLAAVSRRTWVVAGVVAVVVLAAAGGFVGGARLGGDDGGRDGAVASSTSSPPGPAAPSTGTPTATPSTTPPAASEAGTPAGQPAAAPRPSSTSRSPQAASALPAAGWYVVQPGHTRSRGFCWGVGRERNGRTTRPLVVQRSCGEGERTRLVPLGGGVYRLQWHSAQQGTACLAVDYGDQATRPGALLAPRDCGYGGNRFRLERYGGGFRLRPVHSNLCVGSLNGARDTGSGAEAMQANCTGGADQWFVFTPR